METLFARIASAFRLRKTSLSSVLRETSCDAWYRMPVERFSSEDEIRRELKELYVIPKIQASSVFSAIEPILNADFDEKTDELLFPRTYGFRRFGIPSNDLPFVRNPGLAFVTKNLKFTKPLMERRKQPEAFRCMMDCLAVPPYCTYLSLPPGMGKTLLTCRVLHEYGKKALVLLQNSDWIKQWKKELEESMPGIRIGVIQGDTCEVKDRDVVLAMIQTFLSRSGEGKGWRIDDIWKDLCDIEICVFDEAHHVSAAHFSRVLRLLPQRIIALSGTPKRGDGMDLVLEQWIGCVSFTTQKVTSKSVIVHFREIEHTSKVVKKTGAGEPNGPLMASLLLKNDRRNEVMARHLVATLEDYPHRPILYLAFTTEHLRTLQHLVCAILVNTHPSNAFGVYCMDTPEEERERMKRDCRIIFSTFKMFSEAQNVPRFSILYIGSPVSKLSQIIPRIVRDVILEESPLVYIYVENFPPFSHYTFVQVRFFREENRKARKQDPNAPPQYVWYDETTSANVPTCDIEQSRENDRDECPF